MYPTELDDRSFVTRVDPHGMLPIFEAFPDQCREALSIARAAELPKLDTRPGVACLTGLGGSAAGGDIVKAFFEMHGDIPFFVNRDYHLPNYIKADDLVFCASYSGNTEETISAYHDAKNAGATIILISSGGKLTEMAKADGNTVISIPGGLPPRTALGMMLIPTLVACERLGLIPELDYDAAFNLLESCAKTKWGVSVTGANVAKDLAAACHGNLIVLYGLGSWQGAVASRWKGQINENAKYLAFPNAYPELNHNEILGWVLGHEQGVKKFVGILLQDGSESAKMKARAKVSGELIGATCEFHDAFAEGVSLLERILTLTHLVDYVSLYLAALNGVDPENIDSINTLKAELAKV